MLRLIGFIVFLAIFLVFILSNLGNKCDIAFIQWTLRDIPVYIIVFGTFIFGMISSIPVMISISLKKKKLGDKSPKPKKGKKGAESDGALDTYEVR